MNLRESEKQSFIMGLYADDREYVINGVKYVVSSRFKKFDLKKCGPNLREKMENVIVSDFAPLTIEGLKDTMADEYTCSAVGKED